MTLSLTTNMRKRCSGVLFPLPIDTATAGATHSALNACTITQGSEFQSPHLDKGMEPEFLQ